MAKYAKVKITEEMLQAHKMCWEDSDCDDCPARIGEVDCVFSYEKIDSDWIPVTERLPDNVKYRAYLVTFDGKLCGEDEPFTGLCGFENGVWDEDCVLAWMPMPEPYKGE